MLTTSESFAELILINMLTTGVWVRVFDKCMGPTLCQLLHE